MPLEFIPGHPQAKLWRVYEKMWRICRTFRDGYPALLFLDWNVWKESFLSPWDNQNCSNRTQSVEDKKCCLPSPARSGQIEDRLWPPKGRWQSLKGPVYFSKNQTCKSDFGYLLVIRVWYSNDWWASRWPSTLSNCAGLFETTPSKPVEVWIMSNSTTHHRPSRSSLPSPRDGASDQMLASPGSGGQRSWADSGGRGVFLLGEWHGGHWTRPCSTSSAEDKHAAPSSDLVGFELGPPGWEVC